MILSLSSGRFVGTTVRNLESENCVSQNYSLSPENLIDKLMPNAASSISKKICRLSIISKNKTSCCETYSEKSDLVTSFDRLGSADGMSKSLTQTLICVMPRSFSYINYTTSAGACNDIQAL